MSSEDTNDLAELYADGAYQEDADSTSSDTAEEDADPDNEELSEEDQALKQQREKAFKGMVDSDFRKILDGEISIDDIKGARRKEEVAKKIKAMQDRLSPKTDENEIVAQVTAKLKLASTIEQLPEEEQAEAKADYADLIKIGKSPDQALEKVKKLYDLVSESELERRRKLAATRVHRVGGGANAVKESELKATNPKEERMLKAIAAMV